MCFIFESQIIHLVRYKSIHKIHFLNLLQYVVIVFTGLLYMQSCKTATTNSSVDTINKTDKTVASQPKLVFLNYTIYQNASAEKTMTFINKIVVDGKAKKNSNNFKKQGEKGDLECLQLYKNDIILDKFYIDNPLKMVAETVNDDNTFTKTALDLDSTQVSLRIQLHPKATHIRIGELNTNNKVNTLITTKIH